MPINRKYLDLEHDRSACCGDRIQYLAYMDEYHCSKCDKRISVYDGVMDYNAAQQE